MKVKKIILRDGIYSQFDDLITFEEPVLLEDIYSAIRCVKDNVEDYTNEDIYASLKNNIGNFTIEFIGDYKIVEY